MERLSLQLFGALVGPAGAHPDHADRLGCGVILRMLPDEMDFGSTLGPLEHGLQLPDPTRPGATSILGQPAAPPDHQRRIAISSTLAFFQSHFARRPGDREAARRFVWETMPSRAGVQLESGRRAAPEAHLESSDSSSTSSCSNLEPSSHANRSSGYCLPPVHIDPHLSVVPPRPDPHAAALWPRGKRRETRVGKREVTSARLRAPRDRSGRETRLRRRAGATADRGGQIPRNTDLKG